MMKELFQKRLSVFYNSLIFNKQDLWGNSDVVVIHTTQVKNPNSVSSQFYLWLIGEEVDDTTTIFTSSAIYFLCSQKNYTKVRSLCCSATLVQKIPVSVQLKAKNDDGLVLIDDTIRNARVIRNNKLFTGCFGGDDDGSWPFVLGYLLGEYPKSKLFWNCLNELEPRKFKPVDVSCGVSKIISTVDKPAFGVCVSNEKVEFGPTKNVFSPPVNAGKEKGESSKSVMEKEERSNLESKFERIGLSDKGSNLGSEFAISKLLWGDKSKGGLSRVNENLLTRTKSNENVSALMGDLNLSPSSSSGKQDRIRVADIVGDKVFKFGASRLDGKDSKSKEVSKNGDQLFKFGEGKKGGDQLFKLGEGKKDGDQQFKIGGKRGRNIQPQLMEENKLEKDIKLLSERLTAFYSSWRTYKEEQWGKADVLVITTQSVGPLETLSRPVSSSFLVWLLDDEFPETTAVFTDTGIEFLCTKDSFFRLRAIGIRMTMVAKVTVSVQLKKRGEQCLDWLRRTLCQVNAAPRSGANWCPLVVGCVSWESTEIGVLSPSKMFEVAYVDNSLINLFEQGNFESFAAQHSTLPKQFQKLSLETCPGAKTATAVSLSEVAKMKSMDDNSYVSHTPEEEKSLLEKKGDTSSSLLTSARVDNEGQVAESKPEGSQVFEEVKSTRKLADKMALLEIKEGDIDTSITEDAAGEKLLSEERPTAEGGMDDNNGSSRKESAGSDHEDDDWTLIEMECEGQEAEVAERVSWKSWFMGKTGKSFGVKDEISDEAPSKRTKADP